jgi:hypothetical protein
VARRRLQHHRRLAGVDEEDIALSPGQQGVRRLAARTMAGPATVGAQGVTTS